MRLAPMLSTLALLALAAPVAAQHCSDLAVHGDGGPGSTLSFSLSGAAPEAAAFLMIAQHEGHTKLDFGPLGTLTLGLAHPLIVVPIGQTDVHGAAAFDVHVPDDVLDRQHLFAQGLTVVVDTVHGHPRLSFCTSNVAGFSIGGGH